MEIWITPTGETLRGELDQKLREQGHFGSTLKTYILYQYYHCHVTQPLLERTIAFWGIRYFLGTIKQNYRRGQRTISPLKNKKS